MAAATRTDRAHRRADGAPWAALGPLLLGSFVGTLSNGIVNVPVKQIMGSLHVPLSLGALVVISFNVTFAALMPLAGWAGDRYGRRRVFCLALAVLAVGAAGAAAAPDVGALVAARVVEGAGTAAILPTVMSLSAQLVGHERRGRALGAWSAANGLGQALAPLAGGALTAWLSWRAIFLPTLPLAALAAAAALRYVPRQDPAPLAVDAKGATALTFGTAALLAAAAMVPDRQIGALPILATAAAGLAAMALFARSSRRAPQPFLDPALLAQPSFVRSSLAVLAQMFCLASILLAVPLYLTTDGRSSTAVAGLLVFALPATMTVLAPVSGYLTETLGPRPTIRIGLAALGSAVVLLALILGSPLHGRAELVALLLLAGSGVALVQTPAATGATRSAVGRAGAGVGLFNLLRFAGSALGACWVALVLSAGSSYSTVFAGCAVAAAVGLLGTWTPLGRRAVTQAT